MVVNHASAEHDQSDTAARRWLVLMVMASAAIRAVLCVRGGQFFWVDEGRIQRSWSLLKHVGHPLTTLDTLVRSSDHWLFSVVGTVPATAQYVVMRLRGGPAVPGFADIAAGSWISALCFSLSGLACNVLVYAIARRSGAGRAEALLAAFLMFCSTSATIYSRHLLPYDTSLAFALLALWLGMKHEAGIERSVLCGLVAAAAFGVYNGYWLLAAVVLGAHLLWPGWSPLVMIRRALAAGIAFTLPLLVLQVTSLLRMLPPFFDQQRQFSRTVTQGSYAEGWSLPWAYLWHSEHLLLVLWLVGSAALVVMVVTNCEFRRRGMAWLAMLVAIYAGLVVSSVVLGKFVVYGRNAREMVPFLCLATAPVLAAALRRGPNRRAAAVCLLLVAQFSWNLRRPLTQRFPTQVSRLAAAYVPLRHASSFGKGALLIGDCRYHNSAQVEGEARYVLMNTCFAIPFVAGPAAPAGRVVFRYPHPLQYKPYQYEGYSPRDRALLRSLDVSMRLIDTGAMPTR